MLTELQRLTFNLHSKVFCFMYPLPIQWEDDFSQLTLLQSPRKWVFWIIQLVLIFLFGVASAIVPILHSILRPNALVKLDRIQTMFLLAAAGAALAVSTIAYVTLIKLKALVETINEGLELTQELLEDYPDRPSSTVWSDQIRDRFSDRYGVVLYVFVLVGFGSPFVATFVALDTNYDVTYLIVEDISTNPFYRETSEILYGLAFRITVIFSLSLEAARSVTFFGCCALVGIDHSAKIIEILRQRVKRFSEFFEIYTSLRILHARIKSWIHVVIYFSLVLIFWTTVGSCWVCVKGSGKLPWPIYYAAIIIAILLIFGQILILPHTTKTAEMTVEVVKHHFKNVRLTYARGKSIRSGVKLKQARGVAPIKIWYGTFWVIGKKFMRDYFSLLMLRSFDAILIVKF